MAAQSIALDLMTLLDAPGVGPSRVKRVLKRWRSLPGNGSLLDDPALGEGLTEAQVAALPLSKERVARHWEELSKKRVRTLSIFDADYPESLGRVLGDEAPLLLLCAGNLELLKMKSVGFCGSREASEKGLGTAWDSADILAREGINVVSGFAAGVDMNAHRAALAAGGTTTLVLAEGILRFRLRREIRDVWDETRTLVISEFGPNLPWSVSHAMQRNSTICGLSRAMILIEARTTGGSIQAGRDCLRLGLPLFAAVYKGMPESATGNEDLLRHGAHRLMKSRSTGHPNVRPILDAVNITHLAASTQAQPATETARSGGSAECSQTTKSG
jgi:DNA processing protein